MNNELIKTNYNGEEIIFKIEDGVSYVRIDEVAKFCGWTQIKNGKEYVRWETVNKFLEELNSQQVGKGDFVPEYIMYALIGKANSDSSTKFMLWVGQVLTEIRTTGKYDTIEHEIMKIEDEEERKLTLAVYKLEELYKIDNDELTALRLENKKNKLDTYKQNKKLIEIENKVEDWKFIYKIKENYINDVIDKFSKLLDIDFDNNTIIYQEF